MCVLHSKETAYDYLQFKSITEMFRDKEAILDWFKIQYKSKELSKIVFDFIVAISLQSLTHQPWRRAVSYHTYSKNKLFAVPFSSNILTPFSILIAKPTASLIPSPIKSLKRFQRETGSHGVSVPGFSSLNASVN